MALPSAPELAVAYLVNQYPKVSHTFIRREIHALERLGVQVERFSLRPPPEAMVDPAEQFELDHTRTVLTVGVAVLLFTLLRTAVARPAPFFCALQLALKMGWHSDRGIVRNLAYLAEASVLRGWCADLRLSHVHAHFGTNSAAVAMLCRVLGGPPYSFTAHGPEEFERAPYLALGEKIKRAAFVATVSEFGKSQLKQWCDPAAAARLHVVHPILDEAFLQEAPRPVPTAPGLVCVARLEQQKGQLLLVQAMAQLRAQGVCCHLVLIGDGPLRPLIQAEIARLALADDVTLLGWGSGAQVRQALLEARAMVLPSTAENLPSALIEALALQRPVIASNIAGIPELVEQGVSGWLVAPGSVDALAVAMRAALCAPVEKLEAMGRAGAACVARGFLAETETRKLLALFQASGLAEIAA